MAGVLDSLAKGEKPNPREEQGGIYAGGTRNLSGVQIGAFVVGLLLLLPFGFLAARGNRKTDEDKNRPQSITVTCVSPPSQPPTQQGCDDRSQKKQTGKGGPRKPGCPATK
jgi:hypothetical protein